MKEGDQEFDLIVECHSCGAENGVRIYDDPVSDAYEAVVDTDTLFNDAVDYIFTELVQIGFATNSEAIRFVIRLFSQFCEQKAKEMYGDV